MSNEKQEKIPEQVQIMALPETATGRYANFMRIGHSASEFMLDFCIRDLDSITLVSRIVVSPVNMKSFLKALQENVEKYETQYGLKLPDNGNTFIETGIPKNGGRTSSDVQ